MLAPILSCRLSQIIHIDDIRTFTHQYMPYMIAQPSRPARRAPVTNLRGHAYAPPRFACELTPIDLAKTDFGGDRRSLLQSSLRHSSCLSNRSLVIAGLGTVSVTASVCLMAHHRKYRGRCRFLSLGAWGASPEATTVMGLSWRSVPLKTSDSLPRAEVATAPSRMARACRRPLKINKQDQSLSRIRGKYPRHWNIAVKGIRENSADLSGYCADVECLVMD